MINNIKYYIYLLLFEIISFTFASDCSNLKPLYQKWVSDEWKDECCSITQINCDAFGNVLSLDFENKGIKEITSNDIETLKKLSSLKTLKINRNNLTGEFPMELTTFIPEICAEFNYLTNGDRIPDMKYCDNSFQFSAIGNNTINPSSTTIISRTTNELDDDDEDDDEINNSGSSNSESSNSGGSNKIVLIVICSIIVIIIVKKYIFKKRGKKINENNNNNNQYPTSPIIPVINYPSTAPMPPTAPISPSAPVSLEFPTVMTPASPVLPSTPSAPSINNIKMDYNNNEAGEIGSSSNINLIAALDSMPLPINDTNVNINEDPPSYEDAMRSSEIMKQ